MPIRTYANRRLEPWLRASPYQSVQTHSNFANSQRREPSFNGDSWTSEDPRYREQKWKSAWVLNMISDAVLRWYKQHTSYSPTVHLMLHISATLDTLSLDSPLHWHFPFPDLWTPWVQSPLSSPHLNFPHRPIGSLRPSSSLSPKSLIWSMSTVLPQQLL